MDDSHDMDGGHCEEDTSMKPTSSSLVIGNEASNAGILLIDVQGSPQDVSAIPPEEERLPAVAHQTDLASGTFATDIDNNSLQPGGPQAPTFQHNANLAPIETEADAEHNQNNRLTNLSLLIAVQTAITLLTVWLGNGNLSLSHNTKILRDFAAGSNVVGFIAAFSNILMGRQDIGLAARILTIIACAGAAYGFVASMGMLLPDELKLWITFAACALCLPAFAAGLKG